MSVHMNSECSILVYNQLLECRHAVMGPDQYQPLVANGSEQLILNDLELEQAGLCRSLIQGADQTAISLAYTKGVLKPGAVILLHGERIPVRNTILVHAQRGLPYILCNENQSWKLVSLTFSTAGQANPSIIPCWFAKDISLAMPVTPPHVITQRATERNQWITTHLGIPDLVNLVLEYVRIRTSKEALIQAGVRENHATDDLISAVEYCDEVREMKIAIT